MLATRFGSMWAIRLGAFVVLGLLAAIAPRPGGRRGCWRRPRWPRWWSRPGSPGTRAHRTRLLLIPMDTLHVLAMSAWVGGVALLLAAVPHATRELAPDATERAA